MDIKNFGIVLEAETTDCTIEIYLNGIPVGLCGIGGSKSLSRPIHEYLLGGENELGVIVNPGDTPAQAMHFSRNSLPAFHAQPPPDPVMEAFIKSRRDEERQQRQGEVRTKRNGDGAAPEQGGKFATANDEPAAEISAEDESPELDLESTIIMPFGKDFEKTEEDSENNDDEPPDDTSERDFEDEESTLAFSVRLTLYPVGGVAGGADGETLLGIDWSARDSAEILRAENPEFPLAEESAVGPHLFPIWLTKKGDLGEMFGPFQWLGAQPLKLDEETVEEVIQFIFFIRDLVEEGDADSILDISTEKYREIAAAYDISAEERAELFRRVLAQESEKPFWIFETPEDEEISLRLCANNRLIECIGQDWKSVIRGIPSPDGRFLFPMLIGKIEDEWLIMR